MGSAAGWKDPPSRRRWASKKAEEKKGARSARETSSFASASAYSLWPRAQGRAELHGGADHGAAVALLRTAALSRARTCCTRTSGSDRRSSRRRQGAAQMARQTRRRRLLQVCARAQAFQQAALLARLLALADGAKKLYAQTPRRGGIALFLPQPARCFTVSTPPHHEHVVPHAAANAAATPARD